MQISERTNRDVVVFDLEGRLLIDNGAEQLRDKIASALFRGHTRLVLNLARVPHIDSGALGVLVSCYVTVKNARSTLKLAGLNGRVVELLTITKLIQVFDCYDTEQDALATFMATA
jgi:anti-sigma B factor antagonist